MHLMSSSKSVWCLIFLFWKNPGWVTKRIVPSCINVFLTQCSIPCLLRWCSLHAILLYWQSLSFDTSTSKMWSIWIPKIPFKDIFILGTEGRHHIHVQHRSGGGGRRVSDSNMSILLDKLKLPHKTTADMYISSAEGWQRTIAAWPKRQPEERLNFTFSVFPSPAHCVLIAPSKRTVA